ncbi:MAG TPA: hypothetical protein VNT27_12155 [Propionibacteriaceae bacterium]|nr:hypothetical protein [Propionibacteriaceae bacterium]
MSPRVASTGDDARRARRVLSVIVERLGSRPAGKAPDDLVFHVA